MTTVLFCLTLAWPAFGAGTAAAGDAAHATPYTIGDVHTLTSTYLGEERIVNVYVPLSYHAKDAADGAKGDHRYPVLYVLDGSAHEDFLHIVGLVQFMVMYQLMPDTLVVGIANNGKSRYRDFTTATDVPEELKNIPNAGGSPKFLDFVEKEVFPLVEKTYRTTAHRTLIGQSLGGLIATETLVTRPQLFDQYVIISPSLWWNKERLLQEQVPAFLKAHPDFQKQVFIAVGEEGDVMKRVAKSLADTLKGAHIKGLDVHYRFLPDEDHATALHPGAYYGLRTLNHKADKK